MTAKTEKFEDTSLERFQTCLSVGVTNRKKIQECGIDHETGETDPRNGALFWTAYRNIYIKDLVSLDYAVGRWKNP